MRDFMTWLAGFRSAIAGYKYYTDFEKIYKNVDTIKVELNIMNSLIGSENIEEDFISLYKRYPEVDAVISSLALRACDTAKYIAKLQKNSTFFLSPHLNPEVGIEGYTKHQNEIEEDWQTLVVVGHEPAISEFVKSICSKGNLNIKIHKGGVVELEHEGNEDWALVGLRNF